MIERHTALELDAFKFAGGTASGKTTVCDLVKQRLNDQCVVMLSQDCFYRSLTEKELENVAGERDADHCVIACCLRLLGRPRLKLYVCKQHSMGIKTRDVYI